MRDVVVLGAGMTRFGKHPDKTLKDLGRAACWEAIKDAGVSPKDIQYGFVANAIGGVTTGQTMVIGEVVLREVGIVGIPIINVENACCSGASAILEAYYAIQADRCDIAIVCGVEKCFMNDTLKTTAAVAGAGDVELELANGVNFPAHWGLRTVRRMAQVGTSLETLAKVAVKNLKNGVYNPNAQFQKAVTLEEVLNSPMIAYPMTNYSCSSMSDGAAALVICAKDKAANYTNKFITICGFGISTGTYDPRRDITFNQLTQRCGKMLYEKTGIGPEDLDFAEVHDCFTIAEFMRVEALGFYEYGGYDRAIESGECEIGGKRPINPSGGLLAKGHPIGATGVAQVCELVWQLRGVCGQRQVEGARVGLSHSSGGGIAGDGAVAVASILKREY